QGQRDLPRNTTLDKVEVLEFDMLLYDCDVVIVGEEQFPELKYDSLSGGVNNQNFFDMFVSGKQNTSSLDDDENGPSDDAGEVPTFDSSNRADVDNLDIVTTKKTSRVSKLPEKLNDYVLDDRVKYGLNRFANHTKLSADNCCFISNLNKTVKSSFYNDAIKNANWVQAINNEMEALYLNNTWVHTDLPANRKAIGCALRVLKYLKSAPGAGIVYTKFIIRSINAYADLDWAKCKMTRRSVLDLDWAKCKMTRRSVSEYRSMASATCEVMLIVKILKDLNVENVIHVSLFCDNNSVIHITDNPVCLFDKG
nr:putative reverse transcriptase, RNA-dependent DNA polymerase, Gag-polypeptide of LTR copia-type [Tanacetum cinerariifolium]